MAEPPRDAEHWLYRLSAAEWLAAADHELAHAEAAFARRAHRPAITHARRAAGMAWNAALVGAIASDDAERYGRSYMDHVVALCDDDTVPEPVRVAARRLRETPPAAPTLITLGKVDTGALDAARVVVAHARDRVTAAGAIGTGPVPPTTN